tara:strand:+ start:413 stop:742 length:330 start_codon:yes stop_codon:yes gene_type:complete
MTLYSNRKYVIIPLADVEDVDFDQVEQTDSTSLRLSQDAEYTFVKFQGDTPSFLEGKTQYSHAEIKAILSDVNGIWHLDVQEQSSLITKLKDLSNEILWSKYNPFNWFS